MYRLLATSRPRRCKGDAGGIGGGLPVRGQTVFSSAFAGEEVVVLLERDKMTRRLALTIG